MGLTLSNISNFVLFWLASGLAFSFIILLWSILDGSKEELRIKDITEILVMTLAGPLLGLLIAYKVGTILSNYISNKLRVHGDTIIWRSRTSKTKAILFSSKEDDDHDAI